MVRAKFRVVEISRLDGRGYVGNPAEVQSIHLSPVYTGAKPDDENSKFYAATPSGRIELTVVHKDVGDSFEMGKEYYVDFTKAPD